MNKIAAAVLVAGVVAMGAGLLADVFYHPQSPEKRGYEVEVAGLETPSGAAPKEEVLPDMNLLFATVDAAKGAKIFKTKCTACHGVDKGGANRVGPNLHAVLGGAIAGRAGFNYSDGLKAKGSEIGGWDYTSLYQFLKKPRKYVKGTKMAFAGFRKDEDVANVIAYLREQADKPYPLP